MWGAPFEAPEARACCTCKSATAAGSQTRGTNSLNSHPPTHRVIVPLKQALRRLRSLKLVRQQVIRQQGAGQVEVCAGVHVRLAPGHHNIVAHPAKLDQRVNCSSGGRGGGGWGVGWGMDCQSNEKKPGRRVGAGRMRHAAWCEQGHGRQRVQVVVPPLWPCPAGSLTTAVAASSGARPAAAPPAASARQPSRHQRLTCVLKHGGDALAEQQDRDGLGEASRKALWPGRGAQREQHI